MNGQPFRLRFGRLAPAVAVLLVLARLQALQSVNWIKNPGFEVHQGSLPADWTIEAPLRSRGSAKWEASEGKPGYRLLLTPNGRNTDSNQPFGMGQAFPAKELAGKRVTFRAAMRVQDGATAVTLLLVMGRGNRRLSMTSLWQGKETRSLEIQEKTIDVDPGVEYLIVGCVVNGTRGSAWFDDLFLGANDVTTPERAAERTTEPSANNPSVSITVDANRILKPVSRELFGTNIEWIYDANGIWSDQAAGARPEIANAASELGLGPVRFPGGVFADFYHWRDGIGPRSSRPVRPHYSDPDRSRNAFGTDELAEFCRRTGAEPMLQVNILTGTPEEAADWVAYCNLPNHPERIRNGSPSPYKVRFWEIGNEPYLRTDRASIKKTELSPEEYADRFLKFATAMKKVDPTIRVGGVGGHNFGAYGMVRDANWDRVVLQRAGKAMDFFAVHNGYAPVGASQGKGSVEEVYQAMLAFPQWIERDLKDVNKDIETYAPESAGRIKIAITEWGPLFHVLPSDPFFAHTSTLGSALYVSGVLQAFLNADRVEIANFFKLSEAAFMGMLDFQGQPRASYYAMQMFTRHFGTQLVATATTGPSFDTRTMGMAAALQNVPYVQTVSSLSPDGSRLYILAVNRSFSGSIRAHVRTAGFQPRPAGNVWTLAASRVDANNGHSFPPIPGWKIGPQAQAAGGSFDSGKPGTVVPRQYQITLAGEDFDIVLPALSLTSLELVRR